MELRGNVGIPIKSDRRQDVVAEGEQHVPMTAISGETVELWTMSQWK